MSKKGTNQLAVLAAMSLMTLQHNQAVHAFGASGNVYPINNKRGFAARDKRRKK